MSEKKQEKKEEVPLVPPPLEFSSLVLPFFTQGLILLGQVDENKGKKDDQNMDYAKRMIDLLDLLKEKTKGNLKADEEKFLEASIHQLKMAYMEKAKIIKL
jgi:hypothetical protein